MSEPVAKDENAESGESSEEEQQGAAVSYVNTTNLPSFLRQENISFIVTTYQANRVLVFSAQNETKMNMLMRKLPRPTGMALGKKFLAVAAKHQMWFFAGALNLRDKDGNVRPYDLNFIPRKSHVTGFIDAHEIKWHEDQLYVVNTLYSCISVLEEDWSFTPYWKPPFISKIVAEDRCHLNGLAMDENGPRFISALGRTDEKEKWRETKSDGGVLIDIPSGEIVAEGFSMPHSPRIYGGRLFMLESGTGSLLVIDPKTGKRDTVIRFHGFLRGLTFHKHYAFVGVCKAREKKVFGEIPIENEFEEFQCGVAVVNLNTGQQEAYIHFQSGVEELFDIEILPGYINPYMVGFEDDEIDMIKIFQEEK